MKQKHSVYDTDAHFSISAATRSIKNESTTKTTVIQNDHNSERFTQQNCRRVHLPSQLLKKARANPLIDSCFYCERIAKRCVNVGKKSEKVPTVALESRLLPSTVFLNYQTETQP